MSSDAAGDVADDDDFFCKKKYKQKNAKSRGESVSSVHHHYAAPAGSVKRPPGAAPHATVWGRLPGGEVMQQCGACCSRWAQRRVFSAAVLARYALDSGPEPAFINCVCVLRSRWSSHTFPKVRGLAHAAAAGTSGAAFPVRCGCRVVTSIGDPKGSRRARGRSSVQGGCCWDRGRRAEWIRPRRIAEDNVWLRCFAASSKVARRSIWAPPFIEGEAPPVKEGASALWVKQCAHTADKCVRSGPPVGPHRRDWASLSTVLLRESEPSVLRPLSSAVSSLSLLLVAPWSGLRFARCATWPTLMAPSRTPRASPAWPMSEAGGGRRSAGSGVGLRVGRLPHCGGGVHVVWCCRVRSTVAEETAAAGRCLSVCAEWIALS